MSEKSRYDNTNKKQITEDDEINILQLYHIGKTVDEIADEFLFTKDQVRRVINDFESTKMSPEQMKKTHYEPKSHIFIDPRTQKVYYDVTEFFLEMPYSFTYK